MDPYLERHWRDVHADLVALTRTALNHVLPEDLVARINIRRVSSEDDLTETFITILDHESVVTAIEFLTPADKVPAELNTNYRVLRDKWLASNVNVVEIDFVRQGSWRDLLKPFIPPEAINCTYRAIVRRFHRSGEVELYPFSLRQILPKLRIPLREMDADVLLDLQSLINEAYRNGRYDRTDYSGHCRPPLEGEDALWADRILREAGVRQNG